MRKVKILVALVALVMLTAGKCDTGEDTHPNAPQQPGPDRGGPAVPTNVAPNPHEGDPQPTPKRIVTIRAGVPEENLRPWEIIVVAPGADRPFIDEWVTGKDYNTRVLVPVDSTAQISVEVKPPRVGSKMGFCAIESGSQHDGPRFIAGGWRAQCFLTLKP